MLRPFDLIDGKKIDLSIQSHRDEVVKRNKALEKAIKNGIEFYDCRVKISLNVKLNCPVCGFDAEGEVEDDYDGYFEIEKFIPTIECSCCKTKFYYSKIDDTYDLKIKSTNNP